jgi:voltage-gated potassium channel
MLQYHQTAQNLYAGRTMENKERRTLFRTVLLIIGILITGTFGYTLIEGGWTLLDGFYMTLITITTIGYGETHNLSTAGRIFTIFIIIIGMGAAATLIAQLGSLFIEARLEKLLGRRRMQEKLKKISGHYIVCGYGGLAQAICVKLQENDIPFVIIEEGDAGLHQADGLGFLTVKGNPSMDASLYSAGIKRARGLVVAIEDFMVNIVICMAARELNPDAFIIATCDEPGMEDRLRRAGANTIVHPLKLGGEKIAQLVMEKSGIATDPGSAQETRVLGYTLRLFRWYNDEPISVGDALGKISGVQAIALKTHRGDLTDNPLPEAMLEKDDSLVVLVNESGAPAVSRGRLSWDESMSVGVPSIDEEHRMLIRLINELEAGIEDGTHREAVAKTFDSLVHYTVVHFQKEESLFEKYGYPERAEHVQEHRRFTARVMDLNRDKRYIFPLNVSELLHSWLVGHIMGSDRKYVRFFQEKGVR